MLKYRSDLKDISQQLRNNLTDSEKKLWSRLRGKQISGVQFYRQKPIGNYIVDFFASKIKLVIEVDGSQHLMENNLHKDELRDQFLAGLGLCVLRFDSRIVLLETDAVVETIFNVVNKRLKP